jgi:tol-pal system protein YbgF
MRIRISLTVFFITILPFAFVTILSGCSTPKGTSQPTSMPLTSNTFEETMKTEITSLGQRLEALDAQISQNHQRIERLESLISQTFLPRMEELEAKIVVPVEAKKEYPSGSQSGDIEIAAKKAETGPEKAKDLPTPSGQLTPTSDAESFYQAAYHSYTKGDYAGAITGFQEFSQAYPSNDLVDNALYWIGESYYSQGDFRNAVATFEKLVERYPQGNKVPDTLLKIGFSYINLNENQKAKQFLTQVMDNYPFSEASKKAKIKLENLP